MVRTVRAAFISGFDQMVSDLGANPKGILEEVGLSLAELEDPNALVPTDKALMVLTLSAQETNCDHFGLALAKQRQLDRYFGILSDLFKSAPNLGEAIEEIFDLFSIHSEVSLWQLHSANNVAHVTFALLDDSPGDSRQVQQFVLMIFWRVVGAICGGSWHPTMVSFTFSKPTDRSPYRQAFGAPVVFDADFCGVVFHSSDLKIQLPRQNSSLHNRLIEFAKSMDNARNRDFAEEVRKLIRKNLELQQIGEQHILKFFPFQRRTLQRKLELCGTSYRQLLREVRVIMAKDLLANSNITITRMSDRLCFSHIANFTKTFKKYTGLSPSAWREKARLGIP